MKSQKLRVVRGSGNVFRDLGRENADAQQFKAILVAEIIKVLDRDALSVRAAHSRTGIAAADFSRAFAMPTSDGSRSIVSCRSSTVWGRVWKCESECGAVKRLRTRQPHKLRASPLGGQA
jgi:hypothetical protein